MPPVMLTSIRGKIALLVAVAVLVATLTAAWLSAVREADRRLEARLAELQGIAAVLANSVATAAAEGDQYAALEQLRAMARIPRVLFLAATLPSGAPLAELGNAVALMGDATRSGSSLTVTAPVVKSGQQVASIRLVADRSDLSEAFNESIAAALGTGLLAALAGLAIALRLETLITRPIRDLMRAMDDVRATNSFARTVPQTSRDETGRLVGAFNDMLGHIRARDELLARHRDRLEADVAERTRELDEARVAAEQANRAKSEFLATMSHEIRTPMSGMLLTAELLASSQLTPRLQRYADLILRSGRGLVAIIDDILDLSKIEAGKLDLEQVPLDPAALADDTARLFAERAAAKGLELVVDADPLLPSEIITDPVRLGQILSNLTNNALKFTGRGSVVIRLRVSRGDAPRLLLEVADTGIGIPADRHAAIFDPFSQAEQSTTRRYGGTGIGLSICRRLSEAMGGTISLSSTLGEGTTFTVSLPLALPDGAAPRHPMLAPCAADGSRPRVILAFAAGPTREVLARHLEAAGFEPVPSMPAGLPETLASRTAAVIAPAHDLGTLERLLPPAGRDADRPAVWVLARFTDGPALALAEEGRATGVLGLPLTSAETEQLITRLTGTAAPPRRDSTMSLMSASERRATPPPQLAGRHVLAAEDTAVNREILSEALGRLGITVTLVEDGQQALDRFRQRPFDLILMDGHMPRMDGFEAARAIRAWETEEGRQPIPIIALTAHAIGPDAEAWRDAGMNGCVVKPFTLASLANELKRWLTDAKAPAAHPASHSCADAMEPPILDPAVIEEIGTMQAETGDLLARLHELFREHAPVALERLVLALSAGDAPAIAASAHALRSMCANIGAARLASRCTAIEMEARNADLDAARALEPGLEPILAASLDALAAVIPTHRASIAKTG